VIGRKLDIIKLRTVVKTLPSWIEIFTIAVLWMGGFLFALLLLLVLLNIMIYRPIVLFSPMIIITCFLSFGPYLFYRYTTMRSKHVFLNEWLDEPIIYYHLHKKNSSKQSDAEPEESSDSEQEYSSNEREKEQISEEAAIQQELHKIIGYQSV
jgi:hypothetical protein